MFVHTPFLGCTCVVSTMPSRESSFIIWNNRTCNRGEQLETDNSASLATNRIGTQARGGSQSGEDKLEVRSTNDNIFDPRGEDLHDNAVGFGLPAKQRKSSLFGYANVRACKLMYTCIDESVSMLAIVTWLDN